MISNCGSDENGRYSGGKAGDQTGKEWKLCPYYDYPWTDIVRATIPGMGYCIGLSATLAAMNDKIGYDQGQRLTFGTEMRKNEYNPGLISQLCEADCSAGTSAIVDGVMRNFVGKNFNTSCTSRNIVNSLLSTGYFKCVNGKDLMPGDIMVAQGKHVAVWVGDEAKVEVNTGTVTIDYAKSYFPEMSGYYSTTKDVLLMSGAGTGSRVALLKKGTSVKCYGYCTKNFLLVQVVGKTLKGFVESDFLRLTE